MAKPLSCISSFFTILIFLLSLSISAETRGNIPVSKSLTATINSSSWLSPSGDFAFGFHQFLKNNHLFLLAIWYAKIPDTIVWYANEGNPVPRGSTVTLTANQGLILSDPKGSQLWNSSVVLSGADVISHGFMNDTGNLVLESSSNNSTVWQSFEHPTDTLLPTQTMEIDGTVNSRLSETNFTKGRFQIHLQTDGNWVLNVMDPTIYKADIIPYFALDTWKPPNQGKQVIYTDSGNMYLVAANGTVVYNCIPQDKIVSFKDYYQRATLNFDGVLTWYSHPRTSTENNGVGWSKMYSQARQICLRGGCGYNNICSYDDEDQSVRCSCPANYSLIDPNEKYGSCKPDFELWEENGQGANVEHNLVPIGNTQFEKCDGTFHDISVEECKTSCLNDHFCAVATWDTEYGGTCCKKKPLFIGADQSSGVGKIAWLKVGNGTYSTTPSAVLPEAKAKINTVVSVLLGGSVFVNITLLILAMFFICNKKQIRSVEKPCEEYGNVHYFSYEVLEKATNGFKEELGRGAFGIVYKGVIQARTSPMVVAVKKLERISHHADKEFETEVNVIGKTHHKNLVRLVGFCKEKDQRLLVYEYMSNGSLADYLFVQQRPNWVTRIQIAQAIARGLLYLHEECSIQIIHCDIKPQNILLDDHHHVRISDFGMAKLLVLDQTHTNTAIRGTKGYVAPEWFRNKPVTLKVDVYSFGVLLLEIISCRKNVCMEVIEEETAILTDWASDCYQSNKLDSLVNDDIEALHDITRLKRFVMVALWCIQEDPSLRPSMRSVTQMLEGFAEVPVPPCPTSFISATS